MLPAVSTVRTPNVYVPSAWPVRSATYGEEHAAQAAIVVPPLTSPHSPGPSGRGEAHKCGGGGGKAGAGAAGERGGGWGEGGRPCLAPRNPRGPGRLTLPLVRPPHPMSSPSSRGRRPGLGASRLGSPSREDVPVL